jgi:hypothetical protein
MEVSLARLHDQPESTDLAIDLLDVVINDSIVRTWLKMPLAPSLFALPAS